ncbi:MAG: hypothetical protein JXR33_04405 [Coriobacteriia bacterium]|nr:hypothetical protein [Coriobacteriia bacterium]
MGDGSKRVQSTLRVNKDEAAVARDILASRRTTAAGEPPLLTDEQLQDVFVSFVATHAAVEFSNLLNAQDSVALQRIWSRVADATQHLEVIKPIFSSFTEQRSLSDASAKRLWDWIADGGVAKRAQDAYATVLQFLGRTGFSVPLHGGGDGGTKRGRVTKRR